MGVAFLSNTFFFFYNYGRCNRLNIGITLWAELEGGLEAAAKESEEKSLKACRWVQITKISLGFLHLCSCEYATLVFFSFF